MSEDTIKAEARTEFGKGAARRIRRDKKVPAVIYGHGNDPIHVTLPAHETLMALKHGGANTVLNIDVEGTLQLALAKQIQSDPLKGFLEHVDFVAVKIGEKVTVEVPVHLVGEANKEAFVQLENNVVTLEAEATHIPESIEHSIEGLVAGTQILAGELSLPKGSTLVSEADLLIVNITQGKSSEAAEAELDAAVAENAGPPVEAPIQDAADSE
ncbi:MAG: ribosomal protein [Marmoricola sp.]|nr:ribosomal protein [Marmoricola sp.]